LTLDKTVGGICDNGSKDEESVDHYSRTSVSAAFSRTSRDLVSASGLRSRVTSDTLQCSDQQTLEDLTSLVGVTNIFKGFGCVLTSYVE